MEQETIRTALQRNRKAVELRPSIGQGTATTKARMRDGLTCEVEDGKWNLTIGMSAKSGGDGAGPDPGVFGRSALGSCLAIAFTQWAAYEELPLTGVEVEVQADYDVRGQYGLDDGSAAYTQVRYVITVESEAPEEEVARVLEIAESNCPYLYIFRDPQDVRRELRVVTPKG